MNERKHNLWLGLAAALMLSAGAASALAADAEIVKFRLTKWKTAHVKDTVSAETLGETLEKLGCEVKLHAHGDHNDVTYRCAQWRSMALKSHSEAHKWESWLKSKGFETRHEH